MAERKMRIMTVKQGIFRKAKLPHKKKRSLALWGANISSSPIASNSAADTNI